MGPPLQVMDMPLLFETGAYMLTWPRVLVAANPGTQVCNLAAMIRIYWKSDVSTWIVMTCIEYLSML